MKQLKSFLHSNKNTLFGCTDIIVVKQRDGKMKSTPFNVMFGKLKLNNPSSDNIWIFINSRRTCLSMRLGRQGQGYFINSTGSLSMRPGHKELL